MPQPTLPNTISPYERQQAHSYTLYPRARNKPHAFAMFAKPPNGDTLFICEAPLDKDARRQILKGCFPY